MHTGLARTLKKLFAFIHKQLRIICIQLLCSWTVTQLLLLSNCSVTNKSQETFPWPLDSEVRRAREGKIIINKSVQCFRIMVFKASARCHTNLEMTAKLEGLTDQSEEARRIPLNMMLQQWCLAGVSTQPHQILGQQFELKTYLPSNCDH